jgi:hypothetical protein
VPPRTNWPIQHGFDIGLEDLVSDEFKAEVEIRLVEARKGAYMEIGGEAEVLKCKWEGCDNEVSTHKGVAGYCVRLQPNGKTHRRMFIEQQREINPDYGRHQLSRGMKRIDPLPQTAPPAPPSAPLPASELSDGFWLSQVKRSVTEALDQVERAEQDLASAKDRLREILAQAQEMIR